MRPTALILCFGLAACDAPAHPPTTVDLGVEDALVIPQVDGAVLGGPRLLHVGATDDPRPPDGSRARPYASVAAALAEAVSGDVVFMLPGDHAAVEALPAGVELLGAGVDATRLAGPLRLAEPHSRIGGFSLVGAGLVVTAAAEIFEVEVVDAPGPAVAVETAAPVRWQGGGARRIAGPGIVASAADLELVGLSLVSVGGFGLFGDGGAYRVEDLQVAGAGGAAMRFVEATAAVEGCAIADVALDPEQNTGTGVGFIGGEGSVLRCRIEGAERGLRVAQGARVVARELIIHDLLGAGVTANDAASLRLERVEVDGAPAGGLTLTRSEVVAVGVRVRRAGRHGVSVAGGGLQAADLIIEGADVRGISALGSRLQLAASAVRGAGQVCVQITDPEGATALEDVELEGCGGAGVGVFGVGPEPVILRRVSVRDTTLDVDDLAVGVQVYQGEVRLEEVSVEGGEGEGVRLEQAAGHLEDVSVTDTAGPGLVVLEPAAPVTATRLVARGCGGAGVLLVNGGLELLDPDLRGSRLVAEIGPGVGAVAANRGVLAIRGGISAENADNGVSLEGLSTGQITDRLEVSDNGGYGVGVGCGSTLEEPASYIARGNGRGAAGGCP